MTENEEPKNKGNKEENQGEELNPVQRDEKTGSVERTGVKSKLFGKGVVTRSADGEISFQPYGPGGSGPIPSHRLDEQGNFIGLTGNPLAPGVDPSAIPPRPDQPSEPQEPPQSSQGRRSHGIPRHGTAKWPPERGTNPNPSLPPEMNPNPPKPGNGNGGPQNGK